MGTEIEEILTNQIKDISDQLCSIFISTILDEVDSVLIKNSKNSIVIKKRIDDLDILDENGKLIKLRESSASIYGLPLYEKISSCLLDALKKRFGNKYLIKLTATTMPMIDKNSAGSDTVMCGFLAKFTFTRKAYDISDSQQEDLFKY